MKNARVRKIFILVLLSLVSSCDSFPTDTYGTYEEIENGIFLVGYTENPPWIYSTPEGPAGIEADIVKSFAASLDAEIKWIHKNEASLFRELEKHNLHLIVAGINSKSPWNSHVGITSSYIEHEGQKYVIAVPPGEHRFLLNLQQFLAQYEQVITRTFQKYTNAPIAVPAD